MILLVIHIIVALATICVAMGSVVFADRRMIATTPWLLAGTVMSGGGLLFALPAVSLMHLCISGLILTIVAVSLHFVARRRVAYTS